MLVVILLICAAVSFGLGAFRVELKINDKSVVDWLLLGLMFVTASFVAPAL